MATIDTPGSHQCTECGARYRTAADSCQARFEQLLALDHSRQEPWGSRHGQAFAVFALQHPVRYAASLDRAWQILYRVYVLNEVPPKVLASLRATRHENVAPATVPARPPQAVSAPAVTVADLGEFGAGEYATALDAWCRATLRAWGVRIAVDST